MERQFPYAPGYKDVDTSKKTAQAIIAEADTLREKVAVLYRSGAKASADKIAEALGRSVLAIRPRVSELVAQGKLQDTGMRERNASGHMAKVYKWADERKEPTLF